MKSLRRGMIWALVAWCAGGFYGRDVAAQSLGDPLGSGGAAGLGAASSVSPLTPTPFPLFTPTVPSVTADPTAPAVGTSSQGGLMSSPFAAPFMYSSMLQATQPLSMSSSSTSGTTTGTTTGAGRGLGMNNAANLGLLMLMTQQNPGGVGSGQYTGLGRGAAAQTTSARTPATAKRRTAAKPGGLAARYFNRVNPHTTYPQRYFNRQSRYFP